MEKQNKNILLFIILFCFIAINIFPQKTLDELKAQDKVLSKREWQLEREKKNLDEDLKWWHDAKAGKLSGLDWIKSWFYFKYTIQEYIVEVGTKLNAVNKQLESIKEDRNKVLDEINMIETGGEITTGETSLANTKSDKDKRKNLVDKINKLEREWAIERLKKLNMKIPASSESVTIVEPFMNTSRILRFWALNKTQLKGDFAIVEELIDKVDACVKDNLLDRLKMIDCNAPLLAEAEKKWAEIRK